MDRYNQISVSLSQETFIRVHMFYNQPASTKRVLELFFRVEESSIKTTLGSLSQILQEEIIRRSNSRLLKDTSWTQLAIYIPSSKLKVTIKIPTLYGRHSGNTPNTAFRF